MRRSRDSRATSLRRTVNPAADRRTLQIAQRAVLFTRQDWDRAPGQRAPNSIFVAADPAVIAARRPRLSGHALLAQKPNSRCDLAKKLV
jgi:hypothetical protein